MLVLVGGGLLVCAGYSWPSPSNVVEGIEAISGIFSILFGCFGIRRTLSHFVDSASSDFLGTILELVADAVSGIDL